MSATTLTVVIFVLAAIVNNVYPVFSKPHRRRFRSLLYTDTDLKQDSLVKEKEPWEVNEGLNASFFQGDIVLSPSLKMIIYPRANNRRKKAIKKDPKSRWVKGIVPYSFDKHLSQKAKREIHKAIKHWKRHTCIKFHKKRHRERDYIHFVAEDGCWSSVGRQGGEQKIGVGDGCEYFGTIIHEIGHAMGMWHEQSRNDRDTYVKVVWDNIERQYNEQFSKMDANTMDSMGYAYDYESIMHYGSRFFTRNKKHTLRIRKPGREAGVRIGQRKRLSYLDVAQINAMYNCNKVATKSSAKCAGTKKDRGRYYKGTLSYTEKGVTCQPWNKQWPHKHKETTSNYYVDLNNGLMARNRRTQSYTYHNYCRNPQGKKDRPWCYTTLITPEWQYCDLKIC